MISIDHKSPPRRMEGCGNGEKKIFNKGKYNIVRDWGHLSGRGDNKLELNHLHYGWSYKCWVKIDVRKVWISNVYKKNVSFCEEFLKVITPSLSDVLLQILCDNRC